MSIIDFFDACPGFFSQFELPSLSNLSYGEKDKTNHLIINNLRLESSSRAVLVNSFYRAFNHKRLPQHSRYIPKADDVIIELGAFEGFYATQIGTMLNAGAIHAVEIDPTHANTAKRNLSVNGVNHTVIQTAIGLENGSTDAYFSNAQVNGLSRAVIEGTASSFRVERVQTRTIDSVLEEVGERVDLLILQLNGIELDCLFGSNLFTRANNICVAVLYEDWGRISSAMRFLRSKGYKVEFAEHWIFAKKSTSAPFLKVKVNFLQQDDRRKINGAPLFPVDLSNEILRLVMDFYKIAHTYDQITLERLMSIVAKAQHHFGEHIGVDDLTRCHTLYDFISLVINAASAHFDSKEINIQFGVGTVYGIFQMMLNMPNNEFYVQPKTITLLADFIGIRTNKIKTSIIDAIESVLADGRYYSNI